MIGTVVFDLDGTLVQTELLKGISYARAAVELRPGAVTEEAVMLAYRDLVGRSRDEVSHGMLARFGLEAAAAARQKELEATDPADAFLKLRLKHYEAMLQDSDLLKRSAIDHNIALVRRAKAAGKRLALGSMSYKIQVKRVLTCLGLYEIFDFIAARDDVKKGKPDPEIYKLILGKLGSSPLESMAVEDSAAGVGAAVAAGLHCMAVPTELTRDGVLASNLLPPQFIAEEPDKIAATFERMLAGDTAVTQA